MPLLGTAVETFVIVFLRHYLCRLANEQLLLAFGFGNVVEQPRRAHGQLVIAQAAVPKGHHRKSVLHCTRRTNAFVPGFKSGGLSLILLYPGPLRMMSRAI